MKDINPKLIRHSALNSRALSSSSSIDLIELGFGDRGKVEAWINCIEEVSMVYHPVDISQYAIHSLIQRLTGNMGEKIIQQHIKLIYSTFDQMNNKLKTDAIGIKVVMSMSSTIGDFESYGPSRIK